MKEFDFREYIKKGFLEAIGKMADYKIRLNSSGYFDSGVLTAEDLAEIDAKIDAQYPQPDYPESIVTDEEIADGVIEDEVVEESTEENAEVVENKENITTTDETGTVESELVE